MSHSVIDHIIHATRMRLAQRSPSVPASGARRSDSSCLILAVILLSVAEEHSEPSLADILDEVARRGRDDGHDAPLIASKVFHAPDDMGEREPEYIDHARTNRREHGGAASDLRRRRGMGMDRPFRLAGRARGVDNRGTVVRVLAPGGTEPGTMASLTPPDGIPRVRCSMTEDVGEARLRCTLAGPRSREH